MSTKLYKFVGQQYPNKTILWLNPTAPFLSDRNISDFINKYLKFSKKFDSGFTCIELKEFLFNNKGSLNFDSLNKAVSRVKLEKIFQYTNGAYIVNSNHMKKNGTLYGKKPLKYILPWLQSLEVKTASELENFKFFISKYIKENI